MNKFSSRVLLMGALLAVLSGDPGHTQSRGPRYVPKKGFVPDAATAIAIARAVWSPIYGRKQIEGEKPFKASLSGGVWTVKGSLPHGWIGGVAYAEIARKDGRVLKVIHTR